MAQTYGKGSHTGGGLRMNGKITNDMFTPELHMKMCKKIAQLTKVVYHLNTRNDEYEYEVLSIRNKHDLDLQKVIKDAEKRIDKYSSELGIFADESKNQILSAGKVKEKLCADLSEYKQAIYDKEQKLISAHEEEIVGYKRDVDKMREQFQERLLSFTEITKLMEANKKMH